MSFCSVQQESESERNYSIHTFLRIYDPETALQLGYCLPKDQRDMDDLLRLFGDALLKHRHAIFDNTEKTIASMERVFRDTNFANQRFSPVGRFRG